MERLEALSDETGLDRLGLRDGVGDDLITELEDRLELGGESLLKLLGLITRDCLLAEVEDLL